MSDLPAEAVQRIAIALDRLGQEINAVRHVLDDGGPGSQEEMVRRLGHVATRAARIATMVENSADADAVG
jgi:hypothetical protein